MDIREKINELTLRINELAQQQAGINRELVQLINELDALKAALARTQTPEAEQPAARNIELTEPVIAPSKAASMTQPTQQQAATTSRPAQRSTTMEEFVGKNIASKVGILVTIVGIFIGARYAIEHNLVSPLVRILLGYVSGFTLIVLAVFLKKKYEAYSSVLMGGGMAVLYFITFTAYSYYEMMPQAAAFALMFVFTGAAVYAALVYNRVFIAHLGLVGAYAIPFLLSDNSGRFLVLFSYIAIINVGILVISFRKYWKSLYYVSYVSTWLIYAAWQVFSYTYGHFNMAIGFATVYFLMFYATFLAYKLVKNEQYVPEDVAMMLSNAFIYYGVGYALLDDSRFGWESAGLFTVINAGIHFVVSQLIRPRLADRNLYYLVFGLAMVFVTIAVPVQFDGNWVTLLWMAEGVLLFIIGRTRLAGGYEKLSAAMVLLGFISLLHDWINHPLNWQISLNDTRPFANINFISGLLVLVSLSVITYFNRSKKYPSVHPAGSLFHSYFDYAITILLLLTGYFVFFIEINGVFNQLEQHVRVADGSFAWWDSEVDTFRYLVLYLYSVLFTGIVVWVNRRWIKSRQVHGGVFAGIVVLTVLLLVYSLQAMNVLSAYYFRGQGASYFGEWNVIIRYVVIGAFALLLYMGRRSSDALAEELMLQKARFVVVHAAALGILSAEYLLWTGISGDGDQYKLGLSILWGLYGLMLIVWGIRVRQRHFRLAGIALFVATLIKLFVYDLAEAGTVTKTVSFISLGAILLLVSYLYNRYKEVLFGKDEYE